VTLLDLTACCKKVFTALFTDTGDDTLLGHRGVSSFGVRPKAVHSGCGALLFPPSIIAWGSGKRNMPLKSGRRGREGK
jgi:hypothetical protein